MIVITNFSSFLEADIKTNAEDITKNTVDITTLRSDVDEAVEISGSVSAEVAAVKTQVEEVAGSVTSNKTY